MSPAQSFDFLQALQQIPGSIGFASGVVERSHVRAFRSSGQRGAVAAMLGNC